MKRIRIKRTGGMVAPPKEPPARPIDRTATFTIGDLNPENIRLALFGNGSRTARYVAGTDYAASASLPMAEGGIMVPPREAFIDSIGEGIANSTDRMMEYYRAEAALREIQQWDRWSRDVPSIQFPSHWLVKIIPPFGGAIVRFVVYLEGQDEGVSVYLDCYQRLGYFGNEPYWEIYPYAGDTYRLLMADTVELVQRIEHSLTGNYPPEYQDGSEDTDTPE